MMRGIRNLIFIIAFWACGAGWITLCGQSLFRLAGRSVSRADYDRFCGQAVGKDSVADGAVLWQKFIAHRLKLAEAESLGIKNSPSYRSDSTAFRNHLKTVFFTRLFPGAAPVADDTACAAPDRGRLLTAHILISVTGRPTALQNQLASDRIYQIYDQLQQGDDFFELAGRVSDDSFSSSEGGRLPWLAYDEMDPEYAAAAYALTPEKPLSEPLRTAYGWHIIRLVDDCDPDVLSGRKGSGTVISGKQPSTEYGEWVEQAKTSLGCFFSEPGVRLLDLFRNSAEYFDPDGPLLKEHRSVLLFTLAGKEYTVADLAAFVRRHCYRGVRLDPDKFLSRYIDRLVQEEEVQQIDVKYPLFTKLLADYCDSRLVMEVSRRELWSQPVTEESLEKFFKAHKKYYRWSEPRFKGWVIRCNDKKTARLIRKKVKRLSSGPGLEELKREFNRDSANAVQIEHGLYLLGENDVVDREVFKRDVPLVESLYSVACVEGKRLKRGPDSVDDVRSQVEADYRLFLENSWIAGLKEKFPVEIDEDVLKTVNNK